MMRSRPAPASRANSASSAAKNGLDTPFEMDQKVSPEIGWTKAVTYNHLYRWRPSAIGRWPLGAHTRRRIGFSPMRCSSVAPTSIGVSRGWALAPAPACSSFFKPPPAPRPCPRRDDGAGLLHRPVDRLERLPATLGQHRSKPEFARHPGRHLRARPQAAVRGWLKQTSLELVQQVGPQNGGACPVPASQITQSLRTLGVVAGQQPFHPALRIRHRGRDLGAVVAFGQKPDGLKVPRRRHVRAGPVLLLQSRNAQMIGHMRHGSPPRLLALQSILSPNRRESLPTPSAGVRIIGQLRVAPEANEITAALTLLKTLPIEGAIISGDAIFAQTDLCRLIIERGGDYFFTVKSNQPTLEADIALAFRPDSPLCGVGARA